MNLQIALKALEKFDEYYRLQDSVFDGKYNDLGIEARKRILQCIWLLKRIVGLISESSLISDKISPPNNLPHSSEFKQWRKRTEEQEWKALSHRNFAIIEETELLTESFYWIAHRARTVINLLPSLRNFEASGVRDVRNKLIEHPEKSDSGVIWGGFGFGGAQGPVLKALRYDYQQSVWIDAGLYKNAEAFFLNLSNTTENAFKTLNSAIKSEIEPENN